MKRLLAALALFALPAFAAQLVIDIPGCTSYALAGNTVTCATSGGGQPPPVTPPPVTPPPPGSGSLADFDYRANVGQWAAWKFWNSAEFVPLQQRLMARGMSEADAYNRINTQVQFYHHDLSLPGNRVGNAFRCFSVQIGNFMDDLGGACDREIARLAASQNRSVISPLR